MPVQLVIDKIVKYLIRDLWQKDVRPVREALHSISLDDQILNSYFDQEIQGFIFYPYRDEPSSRPIRHTWEMATHVKAWRDCPDCRQIMIKHCINYDRNLSVNHEVNADDLFCDMHLEHLWTKQSIDYEDFIPLNAWRSMTFRLEPDQTDQVKIHLQIYTKPGFWRWC